MMGLGTLPLLRFGFFLHLHRSRCRRRHGRPHRRSHRGRDHHRRWLRLGLRLRGWLHGLRVALGSCLRAEVGFFDGFCWRDLGHFGMMTKVELGSYSTAVKWKRWFKKKVNDGSIFLGGNNHIYIVLRIYPLQYYCKIWMFIVVIWWG